MKKLILASFVVILGACTSKNPIALGSKASLQGTHWMLEDNSLSTSQQITLSVEKNRVFGNGSCNNYFAELITDMEKGTFEVKDIGATKKYCNKMSTENDFFAMLEKVNKYSMNAGVLELYHDNTLLLKFKKK